MENSHYGQMKSKGGRPSNTMHPKRLWERHFSEFIPANEEKMNPTRQCAVCRQVRDRKNKKVWWESRYYCPDCDVAICVVLLHLPFCCRILGKMILKQKYYDYVLFQLIVW